MTTEEILTLVRQGHLFTNEEWNEIKELKQEKNSETETKSNR